MSEYREVRYEHLYVKVPGTEKLRKTAAGRLRNLLATGWREVERWHYANHITVRVERSGHAPLMTRLPKPPPMAPRPPRSPFGQRGSGPGGQGVGERGSGPGGTGGAGPGGPGGAGGGRFGR